MNKKKIIAIVLAVILIAVALFYISPFNRDYTVENATMDLTVSEFSTVYVTEDYDYSFKGEYNGAYREIPLKNGEKFGYFKVNVTGAYYDVEETDSGSGKNVKVYLYSDKDHTKKIRDANVHISYRYSIEDVVTLYDDVGVFQYKLWDKEWDNGINHITATVHLPGADNNTYYLNPEKYTKTSILKGDTLTIKSYEIPKWEIYELLVLMPRDDFSNSTFYGKNMQGDGQDIVLNNLNSSLETLEFDDLVVTIYKILAIAGPAILILAYILFGREHKVDYDGVYEREPPTDEPPEVINAIFDKYKYIGEPDRDGFEASILNIIDRKIIEIEAQNDEESDSSDLILTFNQQRKGELSSSELIIFDTLSEFATDNVLHLSTLRGRLKNQSNAKWFVKRVKSWEKNVKEENKETTRKYFNTTGSRIAMYLGIAFLILGPVLFFAGMFTSTPSSRTTCAKLSAVMFVTGLVAIILPADYFGQWTREGRLAHFKWANFKKFLQDNSLISEYPPESIVIWKKYLIYGAALGVTDKVYEAMRVNVPNFSDYDDDGIFLYHSYGGFSEMDAAIRTGEYYADPPSDSGGGGGSGSFGGGSGGGGGGAF
jgi:uncharacterized membrane protein